MGPVGQRAGGDSGHGGGLAVARRDATSRRPTGRDSRFDLESYLGHFQSPIWTTESVLKSHKTRALRFSARSSKDSTPSQPLFSKFNGIPNRSGTKQARLGSGRGHAHEPDHARPPPQPLRRVHTRGRRFFVDCKKCVARALSRSRTSLSLSCVFCL